MPAYKEKSKNTWYASFYAKDWQGERKRMLKRGFKTKKEALEYERNFLQQSTGDLTMNFEVFVGLYQNDMKSRLKENTWNTKDSVFQKKILPYFKNKKICDIEAKDVIQWQNVMLSYRDKQGKGYSSSYLKTIHNQLSAIFNHAVRYYNLKYNPAAKAGNMGKERVKEAAFWTKEEYLKFIDVVMDKPMFYYAFQVLYWAGVRLGELLALTPADFDFEKKTLSITKSYQRLGRRDVVTSPKTEKSNRTITIPSFLCEEMQEFIQAQYDLKPNERMFTISKSSLHNEMTRASKLAGVQRIKIHGLRHSHVSYLINMGCSAVDVANRMGHESIDITLRYAHMFPSRQREIADRLSMEGE